MWKQIAGGVTLMGLVVAQPTSAQMTAGQTDRSLAGQVGGAMRPGDTAPVATPTGIGYLTLPTLAQQVHTLAVNSPGVLSYGVSHDPRTQNPLLIVNTPLAPLPIVVSPLVTAVPAQNAAAPQQGQAPGAAAGVQGPLLPPLDAAGVVQMQVRILTPVTLAQNALTSITLPTLTFGVTQGGPAPAVYRIGLLDMITPQYVTPAANLADWQSRSASADAGAAPTAGPGGMTLTTFYLPSRIIPIGQAPGGAATPTPVPSAPYYDAITTPFPGFNPLALIGSAVTPNLGPILGPRF